MLAPCKTVAEAVSREFVVLPGDCTVEAAGRQVSSPEHVILIETEGIAGYLFGRALPNLRGDACLSSVMARDISRVGPDALEWDLARLVPVMDNNRLAIFTRGESAIGVLDACRITGLLSQHLSLVRAQLTAVMDTVNEALCLIDADGTVVGWNSRAEKLYGIASGEIIGNKIDRFFSNLQLTRVVKEDRPVVDTYHRPCPGTHVLINARPVKCGDAVLGGISAERDITEVVHLNQELSRASSQVRHLTEEINKISNQPDPFTAIRGHSPRLGLAVSIARKVAGTGAPVLLRGESGTGKEVFARAIHTASLRRGQFVVINCGAIPASLFESELFGYEAGAFTGADKRGKPGLFEVAAGGTVFLDEIGEMPVEMQVKLLRVLQDKVFYRIGGCQPVAVDVRIIAATHRDLEGMIRQGAFREDLYYRLNVVTLVIPPLRERKEDIPELVYLFLQDFNQAYNKAITRIDPAVMAALLEYSWPGNVRELKNVIERLVVLAEGDRITAEQVCLPGPNSRDPAVNVAMAAGDLVSATAAMEREIIMRALEQAGGSKTAAAKRLGIPRSTLYYKLQLLGLRKKAP